MIDLHYWPTPNGHKVTLLLEETGIEYRVIPVDIGKGAQFEPGFLAISPNNRMPAIVDHAPADGGAPLSVFESGAILMYLAEKSGQFLPTSLRARNTVLEWLFWQMAGLGPMTGQHGHFSSYAPEKIPYAMDRYRREATRLLGVLEQRLAGRAFIAGDAYSIADMACYPWIDVYKDAPLEMAAFPGIERWRAAIRERPATQRAYALSKQVNPEGGKPLGEEERKLLFGQGAKSH